jgi:hypothetical protein
MSDQKAPKRGPRRKDGAALEPLTIRMAAKLKYGLELLARAQHRSLSQAVEWALQVGLNNFEVGTLSGSMESIGTILDKAWEIDDDALRVLKIYNIAPGLLTFEESKSCELVDKSREANMLMLHMETATKSGATFREASDQQAVMRETLERFVSLMWSRINAAAVDLANSGKSTANMSLLKVVGLDEGTCRDPFSFMDQVCAHMRSDDPDASFKALLQDRQESIRAQLTEQVSDGFQDVAIGIRKIGEKVREAAPKVAQPKLKEKSEK